MFVPARSLELQVKKPFVLEFQSWDKQSGKLVRCIRNMQMQYSPVYQEEETWKKRTLAPYKSIIKSLFTLRKDTVKNKYLKISIRL